MTTRLLQVLDDGRGARASNGESSGHSTASRRRGGCPAATRRLLERFASALPQRDGSTEAPAGLTTRETEVLRLLAGGLPNAEIAAELVVSEAKRRRTSPACCASWGCATASRR